MSHLLSVLGTPIVAIEGYQGPGANFPGVGVEVEQSEEGLVVEEGTYYSHIEESLPAAVNTVWLDID